MHCSNKLIRFLEYISSHYSAAIRLYVDLYLLIGGRLNPMAAAEALMELVPSGNSRRNGPQSNNSALENDEEKERAMAATYAAYTKRTKLHAEKAKAQQVRHTDSRPKWSVLANFCLVSSLDN